ncbi:hypothetical protein [Chromohalobacter japonicus]|uniref:hypothetical protein n=1 Tax=Chromohalobacter japonicus TaxID=223900 RepID=UPI001FF0E9A6|nr:hypothetical protein [Chromohalobacter japonicus]MCK0753090.1 hypothetical protein [Chromohalobacter japonicus]
MSQADEIYDAVVNGIADIGITAQVYTHGCFPLSQIVELPGVASSAPEGPGAIQMLYDDGQIRWRTRRHPGPFYTLIFVATMSQSIYDILSPGQSIVLTQSVRGFTRSLLTFVLALPAWWASVEQLPRLTSGVFFFGYLLVFAITVSGSWVSDISGHVALAFVSTLILSLTAMAGYRLLVSFLSLMLTLARASDRGSYMRRAPTRDS